MKTKDARQNTRFGTVFRLGVRMLGLLGALAAATGACIAATELPKLFVASNWNDFGQQGLAALTGSSGLLPQVGAILLAAGAALVLLWFVVEVIGGLTLVTGRKSAAGFGNGLQVVLAVALLVVANAVSFGWFWRKDFTADRRFTIPAESLAELKKLDPNTPTTIVVLQRDKTSALEADQDDALTASAQQKITEKVLDLVEELRQRRDIGSRLDVHILRTKDENYPDRLAAVAPNETVDGVEAPSALRRAIDASKENCILFAANGRVRRLPFNQFFMLDKSASLGSGAAAERNLVLSPQGTDRFVKALVSLETRTPTIGLATIHPLLSSRETRDGEYTSLGLRTALEGQGYRVQDIILKKWGGRTGPSPAATTFDETQLAKAENKYNLYSLLSMDREQAVGIYGKERDRIAKAALPQLDKEFRRQLGKPIVAEKDRTDLLKELDATIALLAEERDQYRKMLAQVKPEYDAAMKDDRLLEVRRETDVKAKLNRYVAECDALIVPRYTIIDVVRGQAISARLYSLSADQADVVREFLKAGKPVLFAFGPTNADAGRGPEAGPDDVEKLLGRLGVDLGSTTVLTDQDVQQMSELRGDEGQLQNEAASEQPPLKVILAPKDGAKPNPIALAYAQLQRSLGTKLELKKGAPRPITVRSTVKSPFATGILETVAESWNESKPLPDDSNIPKFDPPKPNDPKKGTPDEERRGPFTVAVAYEANVPAEWIDPAAAAMQASAVVSGLAGIGLPPGVAPSMLSPDFFTAPTTRTVRIAAYGHGGIFVGKQLEPSQVNLLASTTNWLLKREDELPKELAAGDQWKYPRVALSVQHRSYWTYAAFPGLPVLAFVGLAFAMLRRAR